MMEDKNLELKLYSLVGYYFLGVNLVLIWAISIPLINSHYKHKLSPYSMYIDHQKLASMQYKKQPLLFLWMVLIASFLVPVISGSFKH